MMNRTTASRRDASPAAWGAAHPSFIFRHSASLVAAGALLFLLLLAAVSMPGDVLLHYRERANTVLVPGMDRITGRAAEMVRQGLLTLSPRPAGPLTLGSDTKETIGLMGVPIPEPDATKLAADLMPSTALLPPSGEQTPPGVIDLSIVCGSDDLFGPEHGILTHPHDRGHGSERLAWMTAREGPDLLLESPFGLRIHGGDSRNYPAKSFALLFREEYGARKAAPAGLFFGPDTPPARRIVLLNGANPARCLGVLALDIAARLGCTTSRRASAIVHLNGARARAPFFLFEHQSPDFIRERFHLEDIEWVRLKSSTALQRRHDEGTAASPAGKAMPPVPSEYEARDDDPSDGKAAFAALEKWLRHAKAPLSLEEAAARYDIDDLCNWVLAIAYTGCFDNDQGGYFRDRSKPGMPWRGVVWDLDGAFGRGFFGDAARNAAAFKQPFDDLLLHSGFRVKLFRRLVEESPEFRARFRNHAREALEEKLPRQLVMAMVEDHARLLLGLPDAQPRLAAKFDELRAFLARRHESVLAALDERFSAVTTKRAVETETSPE